MQPHSISALAVANYVFFFYGQKIPKSATVELSFPKGKTVHSISNIEVIGKLPYIDGLKVPVRTKNGDLCTITIKRRSSGSFKPDEEYVIATHSIQHIAGLEEHYRLSRHHIYGFLRNSEKYGKEFGADVVFEGQFTIYYDEWTWDKERTQKFLALRQCSVKFVPTSFQTKEMAEQKVVKKEEDVRKEQEKKEEQRWVEPKQTQDNRQEGKEEDFKENESVNQPSESTDDPNARPDSFWKLFVPFLQ